MGDKEKKERHTSPSALPMRIFLPKEGARSGQRAHLRLSAGGGSGDVWVSCSAGEAAVDLKRTAPVASGRAGETWWWLWLWLWLWRETEFLNGTRE